MTCDACTRAETNPRTGIYRHGCTQCDARALANSPEFAEAARDGKTTPRYRMALASFFPADEQAGHEAVKVWARRLARNTAPLNEETP